MGSFTRILRPLYVLRSGAVAPLPPRYATDTCFNFFYSFHSL